MITIYTEAYKSILVVRSQELPSPGSSIQKNKSSWFQLPRKVLSDPHLLLPYPLSLLFAHHITPLSFVIHTALSLDPSTKVSQGLPAAHAAHTQMDVGAVYSHYSFANCGDFFSSSHG